MGESTTIKVIDASIMNDYGSSVSDFATSIESAAADTSRSFTTRVEGNYAEAINAFFTKLNTLQTQVFEVAPSVLKTYGTAISSFVEAIHGEGFTKIAYTSEVINTMASELKGKQLEEISAVKAGIKTILEEIVAELGKGESNIKGFSGTAKIYMEDDAKNREETHKAIVNAHDSMTKVVGPAVDNVATIKEIVDNARVMVSISPQEIISSIKHGALTKDTMYYLDAVHTDEDVKAIKLLMSEGSYKDLFNEDGSIRDSELEQARHSEKQEIFNALGRLKGKNMSLGTMEVIVKKFETEFIDSENGLYNGNLPYIEAFFSGLSEQEPTDVQEYTSRLSIAAGEIAKGLRGKAEEHIIDFSSGSGKTAKDYLGELASGQAEIMQIDNRMHRLAKIDNLFKFVYENSIGTSDDSTSYIGSGNKKETFTATSKIYLTNLRINDKGEIELYKMFNGLKSGEYSLQERDHFDDQETKNIQAEIDGFEKKKQTIILDDGYKIAKSALSLYSPQTGVLLSIIEEGINFDKSDVKGTMKSSIKVAEGISKIESDDFYKTANRSIKLGQSIVDAYFRADEYDKEIKELKDKQSYLFYDTGGRSTTDITDGKKEITKAKFDSTFDLSSHLQRVDFEKNGMRGMIAREAYNGTEEGLQTATNRVNKFDNDISETTFEDEKIKKLLAGSSGNVTLSDVGVNNVKDELSNLSSNSESNVISESAYDFTKKNAVSFNKYTKGHEDYKLVKKEVGDEK